MTGRRQTFFTFLVTFSLLCVSLTAFETRIDFGNDGSHNDELAITKALGIGNSRRKNPSRKEFLVRKFSAPKFMMNLFNELNSEVVETDDPRLNLTDGSYVSERKYLKEAKVDTVVSFFNYVHDEAWERSERDMKLKFNAKFSSETEHVMGGEFKLYKRLPRNRSMADSLCTISVYTIQPAGKEPVLLDIRHIRVWEHGWKTFNVTDAVRRWIQFPQTNHGLQLVVRNSSGEEVDPHGFGLVGKHGNQEKRPYLVGFVNTTRAFPTFKQEVVSSLDRRTKRHADWGARGRACHLQKFYVNFRRIGLDNTIIAPKGYYAHYCQGACVYPLEQDSNATNHAVLQTLAHLVNPDELPNPCCAPATLKPLTVLFFDDNNNVVLKRHAEMIVTSCACQ